jgi:ABC-type antimicrobial peptide transport system permease subunit
MSVVSSVRVAVRAIGRNRLRSALTLVGITIGVAVVITMVAIGSGAQRSIEQQVRAAGANLVTVSAGNFSPGDLDPSSGDVNEPGNNLAGGASVSNEPVPHKAAKTEVWAGMSVSPRLPGRGASTTLTTDDVEAIWRMVPGVHVAAAGVSDTAVMMAGGNRLFGRLQGTDVQFAAMRGMSIRAGRSFSARDVEQRAPVLVLSEDAAAKLFGSSVDPLGKTVQIRQRAFTVRGVIERAGWLAAASPGATDEVFVPYTAVQDLLKIGHLQSIAISVVQAGESTRAALDVTRLLRTRHGLGPTDPDDFIVRTQAREAITGKGVNPLVARAVAGSVVNLDQVTLAEIASSLERSSRTMTALLASVASVSLLVGGIGIMNIMLVSVTERTREIGLRMAVGARGQDVLIQFLTEAVTLSLVGGIAGIAIGIAASGGLGRMLRWATVVTPASIGLSVSVAAAVGVFFGFYPARQASRLDPIDALRYE